MRMLLFAVASALTLHLPAQAQELRDLRQWSAAQARSICAGIGSVRGYRCLEDMKLIERNQKRHERFENAIAKLSRSLELFTLRMEAYQLTRNIIGNSLRAQKKHWYARYEVPSR